MNMKPIALNETALYLHVTVDILQNLHPPGNNHKVKAVVVELVCSLKPP